MYSKGKDDINTKLFNDNGNALKFQGGYGIVLTPFNEDGKVRIFVSFVR